MKRKISADKETKVKAPVASKTHERQFSEQMESMVFLMSKLYRSQVLDWLNQTTVNKFEDAQTGNFAAIFLARAKKINRQLVSRFDDDRVDDATKGSLGKVNKSNQNIFYKSISDKVGIDFKQLVAQEGMKSTTNAYMLETSQWAKKLRDETLEEYTANTLRAMAQGDSISDIMKQFDGVVGKRKDHAKFTARNQINNFNSILTKTRAQNLGIQEAEWVTSRDARVRKSHKARDGKKFDLSKGLYSSLDGKTLIPGTDYQCRCTMRLIIPELED